jgi:hypothetical protein
MLELGKRWYGENMAGRLMRPAECGQREEGFVTLNSSLLLRGVKNRIETRPAAAALSMRADRSQAKSKPCGLHGRIPRVRVSGCIGVARWQLAYVQADEQPSVSRRTKWMHNC